MAKILNMHSEIKASAIIQARMNSSRFPGKVLKKIGSKSVLEFLIDRLQRSKNLEQIVLATTTNSSDDDLERLAKTKNINIFRGSENDVLSRFSGASKICSSEILLRITADCPLIDPELVDELILKFLNGKLDYLSNCFPPSYPDGFDLEAFSKSCLEEANQKSRSKEEREHVTPWIRKNPKFKIGVLKNKQDLSHIRLTIDEPEDLIVIRKFMDHFSGDSNFKFQQVVDLINQKPQFLNYNSNYKRNMGSKMSNGQKLWSRAKKVIPGGNMLLSKRPDMFLPNAWPTYFKEASGCKIWDLDGNEFTDMTIMGVGTNILGYGHNEVDEAVSKTISKGNMSTLNCPEEVLLAEKLIEINNWGDMVKFARTGGEANSIAIRIARAASGRKKVAICGYHGWHDWYLSTNIKNNQALSEHLLPGLEPNGVPDELAGTVIPFKYNDFNELKEIVKNNDIGIIKMEVERTVPPKDGFLKKVRDLCNKKNIILIFDECTSGFRETFGGLHKKYDVNPDMAIFGKALGNGYAITAVVGTKEVMESAQTTFISSTFWTERIGYTAALKTLEVMNKLKSWEQIKTAGIKLRKGWQKLADSYNLQIAHSGIDPLPAYSFIHKDNLKLKTFITQEMLKKGFLASQNCYLCTEHNHLIIDLYLNELDDVFQLIKKALDNENIDSLLEHDICSQGFKRLN